MAVFKIGGVIKSADGSDQLAETLVSFVADAGTATLRKWIQSRSRDMLQAVTKILNGDGKPTGDYAYHGLPILHASAGVANRTGNITIFYVIGESSTRGVRVLAIGEHDGSRSYRLKWKDDAFTACAGSSISL